MNEIDMEQQFFTSLNVINGLNSSIYKKGYTKTVEWF